MSGANQAMQFFGPQQVADALPWAGLIEAIETAMVAERGESPDRTMHSIPAAGAADAALLLKPAWIMCDLIAVKVVSVFPDNGALDLPTMTAQTGATTKEVMARLGHSSIQAAMRYQHVAADRNREMADRLNDVIGPLGHGARRRRFAGERLRRVSPGQLLERVTRIELAYSAWEADVLPLNYTRRVGHPP